MRRKTLKFQHCAPVKVDNWEVRLITDSVEVLRDGTDF